MRFPVYPWHKTQWRLLAQQLDQQRFPHALLLHGVKGTGKLDFAIAWSHYLLCQSRNKHGDKHREQQPCGLCASCNFFAGGFHPDLLLVHKGLDGEINSKDCFALFKKQSLIKESTKDAKTKTQTGSNIISVDRIGQIQHFLLKKAHQAGYKVVIIYPAETMNVHAVNALLKILEEPPENTVFLLVSHHKRALLLTLISRAWQLALPAPDQETALNWLIQEQGENALDTNKAAHLFAVHAGAVLKVKQMLLQGDKTDAKEYQFLQKLQGLGIEPNRVDLVDLATEMAKTDFNLLLDSWRIWVEDIIRYSFTLRVDDLADKANLDWYRQVLSSGLGHEALFRFYGKLSQQVDFVLRKINVNKTLVLQSLLLYWLRLVR